MNKIMPIIVLVIGMFLIVFAPFHYRLIKNIYKHGFHMLHTDIEQTVDLKSVVDRKYYVMTSVRVHNILDFTQTIEESYYKLCTFDEIKQEQEKQMIEANKMKEKIDLILFTR